MLDQSFSFHNFNKIFISENKKGNIDRRYINQAYLQKHKDFKRILDDKKSRQKLHKLSKDEFDDFATQLDQINKEKEIIRLEEFKKLADQVNAKDFHFNVKYHEDNEIFTVDNSDAASFYAIKQLQYNIRKTFKVKQSSRNDIIRQVFNLLSDGFPKVVIRTDIRHFYESIPQDKLFKKIDSNVLLSPHSKKLIRKLFYEFEDKKDKGKINYSIGIPRGIGISAYLSELFMRDIDNRLKDLNDLTYYARYVDDIIMVFTPKTLSSKEDYLVKVREIITDNNLELSEGQDGNESKTKSYNLIENNTLLEPLTFLGYKFFSQEKVSKDKCGNKITSAFIRIELSDSKMSKYKKRLTKSVEAYNNTSKFCEKDARKLLFERLKFLTGNFHLNHNKKSIKSGVYYSNSLLLLNKNNDCIESLKKLNFEMRLAIRQINPPNGIKKGYLIKHIINNFDFEKGFFKKDKYFYSFKLTSSEERYYQLKYGDRRISKFDIIKSIWKDE
ncbi:MAG: Reverse transcriptase (RNA-dependent DNA polymerase) [Bacteroidetes bacterium ADurb.Bin174]|nr:MAG: Reverse transcriptase (RNA-dependent DNA polymerase) [Bacteroidetes bacterium ADurb.Bin174]